MYFVRMARRIFHRDHHAFFAGTLCQIFGHQRRYVSLLCYQHGGHETYQDQNYVCERHTSILRLTEAFDMLTRDRQAATLSTILPRLCGSPPSISCAARACSSGSTVPTFVASFPLSNSSVILFSPVVVTSA